MPSPFCTATAVAGKVLSGVEVASTIRSIAWASSPACSSAARAALIARCEVNSPSAAIWRCRMPVRCTIHSSEVSIRAANSALAFDNQTFQSKQHATIGLVRIELLPERLEGAAGEQIANLGLPAARHRIAQKIRHLACGTFRGLQRDVAAETFRHDHVSRAPADP